MARQSAKIKVLCRADALQETANMLQWAIGHRIEVADTESDDKIACLFIFTDVEDYENDTMLLELLGFDIIGKIRGVVSWEVLPQDGEEGKTSRAPASQNSEDLEAELICTLYTLPITISIMPRMERKYAWKCLEGNGQADTFIEALEQALTHLMRVFKLMRSELMG
jgi:hypothetical protein